MHNGHFCQCNIKIARNVMNLGTNSVAVETDNTNIDFNRSTDESKSTRNLFFSQQNVCDYFVFGKWGLIWTEWMPTKILNWVNKFCSDLLQMPWKAYPCGPQHCTEFNFMLCCNWAVVALVLWCFELDVRTHQNSSQLHMAFFIKWNHGMWPNKM